MTTENILSIEYRVHRVDKHNLAIQRWTGKNWKTLSYHGNSIPSLIKGIEDLIGSLVAPTAESDLTTQLGELRLAIVEQGKIVKESIIEVAKGLN